MAGLLQQAGQSLNNEQMGLLKQGFQLGQQIIYDKNIFGTIVKDAQKESVEQGLAQTVVSVMMKIQEQLGQLDMLVATSIGIAILGDVADAFNQIGMQVSPDQVTAAFEIAVQLWLSANSGQYNPNEVQAAVQQMGGMQ